MRNVFLLYMPLGNAEAMAHYQDTIKNRIPMSRISRFVSSNLRSQLTSIFGSAPIAVWGSQAGERNREKFERMSAGDDVLIVEGDSIKLIGKVAAKVESVELSQELWKPLSNRAGTTWQLVYFIANPRELDVPFKEFCRLFGYQEHFQLRGFTTVSPVRLESFYAHYDDLYSVLVRIQQKLPIHERPAETPIAASADIVEVTHEEIDEVLKTEISDHVRMQWKLARLGIKAGERVWVPAGDQTRLRQAYQFDEFDPQFSSGIDLPHSYIENIDVVWKQEFRIGAAYEIENSTSIYSGLLRFADLNIVAPNTLYPMFVVAPRNRKNRLREQLRRPTFKKLQLDKKVLFLPYETIDEIDTFFESATKGVSVDLILGKAESVV
ncbi:MAG: hypothetical protein ABI556_10185 [Gemmatimonadales bacterium]